MENKAEPTPVSVGFISLGCSKNLVDSQVMAGLLLARKISLAPSADEADVLVVNTCAFIEAAREEAAETILSACAHKAAGGCRAVIVTGCLPQRYRGRVRKVFPDVDAFLGVDELDRIPEVVDRVAAGRSCPLTIAASGPVKTYEPPYPTLLFTGGPFAYIKIGDGCDHRCAYCAIPGIRGSYRSRPIAGIMSESRRLVEAGVREINLISQDTLIYGCDRKGSPRTSALLRRLAALAGDFRVRLLYGYPGGVTDELLETLASDPKFCRYLDLPVQHVHPDILRAMNRGDIADQVAGLPERIRRLLPGVTLRTTCLVGFPGETDAHFQMLLDFVKTARFDHLGVFAFSPEAGTAAFKMAGRPSDETAQARCAALMAAQKKIAAELNRTRVGQTARALLLQPQLKGHWLARIDQQAPDVDGVTRVSEVGENAMPGDLVSVELTGARGFDLTARAM